MKLDNVLSLVRPRSRCYLLTRVETFCRCGRGDKSQTLYVCTSLVRDLFSEEIKRRHCTDTVDLRLIFTSTRTSILLRVSPRNIIIICWCWSFRHALRVETRSLRVAYYSLSLSQTVPRARDVVTLFSFISFQRSTKFVCSKS